MFVKHICLGEHKNEVKNIDVCRHLKQRTLSPPLYEG